MSLRYRERWPGSEPMLFGWVYEAGTWDECNERLAAIIVCEFLRWGMLP